MVIVEVALHIKVKGKLCCGWCSSTGLAHYRIYTSEMIHHHGASLSKQQTADLLICHGSQQDLSLSTV